MPRPLPLTFLLLAGVAAAQDPAPKASMVFKDGEAQTVPVFKDANEWIREWLFVETTFDSDGDGQPDRMHVDVWRPKQTDTEGLRVPVVYETSPYFSGTGPMDLSYYYDVKQELGQPSPPRPAMKPIGFGNEPGMIASSEVRRWLPRGFAVVHSCSPGTGWSQGCPTVGGDNEALAPKCVIDWLCGRAKGFKTIDGKEEVKATWCTGKVGMIGTSYNGALPIAAATTGVEGLCAIIPISGPASWYLYYRSNGLVRSPGGYLGEDMDVLYDFIDSGTPKRRDWCDQHVRDEFLRAAIDRVTGDYNDFWASRDYLAKADHIKAAALVCHAWGDWNVMPDTSVQLYAALEQRGVPCMAFFGQGGHGDPPPFRLVNRWFTRFLCGVDNGVEKDPKAWIVREGEQKPTPYADYPLPDTMPVMLHPTAGGDALGGLAFAAAASGNEKLVDDASIKAADLAMAERSEHRLLYATPELREDVHLSGTTHVVIRMTASKPATNLSVYLVSLPWEKGAGHRLTDNLITRGWADPQNHASLKKGEPLVPGTFVDVGFDLQPDDQIVQKGQRIGLMVFASDHEFTLWPAPGTELTVDLAGTSVTLPVVGGAEALKKAFGSGGDKR